MVERKRRPRVKLDGCWEIVERRRSRGLICGGAVAHCIQKQHNHLGLGSLRKGVILDFYAPTSLDAHKRKACVMSKVMRLA